MILKVCRHCGHENLELLTTSKLSKHARRRCESCHLVLAKVGQAKWPKVPDHLSDRIRRVANYLMIPAEPVREVLRAIDPEMTPKQLSFFMGRDWASAKDFYKADWLSDSKVDEMLSSLHCNHLWYEEPLKKYHDAILEYEALYTRDEEELLVAA